MVKVTIPRIETERLILRAPQLEDAEVFVRFLGTARAKHIGGPISRANAVRAFGHVAGLWVMRGYSSHVATLKDSDRAIGMMGIWFPLDWPEPEFGWSIWDGADEGKGYVTEALRTLIPWTWEWTGLDTAISVIDEDNAASIRVAERLGAVLDDEATAAANAPGHRFHEEDRARALIYRHHQGAWA